MKQNENEFDGSHDLQHFLRLAAAQTQARRKKAEASTSDESSAEVKKLRLLEELIREQIVLPKGGK